MRPHDEEIQRFVEEWLQKASLDLKVARRLVEENEFRDIVVFHAQQSAEKHLKALLTLHQVEFPKTHVIAKLLGLLHPVEPELTKDLDEANWLTPFGAEIRYPGDRAEAIPGDEQRALHLAELVGRTVLLALDQGSPKEPNA